MLELKIYGKVHVHQNPLYMYYAKHEFSPAAPAFQCIAHSLTSNRIATKEMGQRDAEEVKNTTRFFFHFDNHKSRM